MGFDFDDQEYSARLARTRAAMAAREIDLLIVSDPSNMAWLSGYDGWSFYVHQCVVLPATDAPLWYGREMDAAGARMTVNQRALPGERIIGYADHYIQNPKLHPLTRLGEVIAEHGWSALRIGVEMDNYYYSAAAHQALCAMLPDATLVDATALVNWQRAIKSDAELVYMKRAARIVEQMHRRAFELIAPGVKKNQLVAEIYRTGIAGADGHGGDYPAIVPLVPTGRDAGAPHLTWDERPIPPNSGTFFEIAGVHRRYHCPLSRTIYLGEPPDEFRRAEAALQEGIAAGLAVAKPGNQCRDIANALFAALRKHGFEKNHRCGYSIGLSYPPDWGERTMSFRAEDQSVLQEGMAFHFMPGLWLDAWGIEITESLVITASGCQTLADYPRELLVKKE